MPHLPGGWINTTKFENNIPIVYIEKVLRFFISTCEKWERKVCLYFCSAYIYLQQATCGSSIRKRNMQTYSFPLYKQKTGRNPVERCHKPIYLSIFQTSNSKDILRWKVHSWFWKQSLTKQCRRKLRVVAAAVANPQLWSIFSFINICLQGLLFTMKHKNITNKELTVGIKTSKS